MFYSAMLDNVVPTCIKYQLCEVEKISSAAAAAAVAVTACCICTGRFVLSNATKYTSLSVRTPSVHIHYI